MPSRWSVLIQVPDPQQVRADQLYGLVSRWFEGHLDDAGHHAPRKPYTVSPLRPLAGGPADVAVVDIGLLDDGLLDLLLDGVHQLIGDGGRLGPQTVRGQAVDDDRPVLLDVAADWAELAATAAAPSTFDLELLSPTVFRSGRLCLPFPTPGLVLGHLRQQWTIWGPDVVHPSIDDCEVEVVDHRITCERRSLRGRTVAGSMGVVSYRIRSTDDAHRAAVARWLAVLPFAGLGADTRMGLGQARVVTPAADRHRSSGQAAAPRSVQGAGPPPAASRRPR